MSLVLLKKIILTCEKLIVAIGYKLPLQCFVLIVQSDSTCPRQFFVSDLLKFSKEDFCWLNIATPRKNVDWFEIWLLISHEENP